MAFCSKATGLPLRQDCVTIPSGWRFAEKSVFMADFWIPAESSGEIVAPDQLTAQPVVAGLACWRQLTGTRRYPARPDNLPRHLGSLLRNVMLVRVLEDGDYEYRIVGDALVQGFNENFSGRRLSSIIEAAPKFGLGLRMLYEAVRIGGDPLGYRGWAGRDLKGAQFAYHENAILPFGPDDTKVDHLLIVSAIMTHRDNIPPVPPGAIRL
jgi:hypothetical protein